MISNFELREAKGREDSKVCMESVACDRLNKEVRKRSWNQQTGSIKRSANGRGIGTQAQLRGPQTVVESADRLNKEVRKQSWNRQTGSIKRSTKVDSVR